MTNTSPDINTKWLDERFPNLTAEQRRAALTIYKANRPYKIVPAYGRSFDRTILPAIAQAILCGSEMK